MKKPETVEEMKAWLESAFKTTVTTSKWSSGPEGLVTTLGGVDISNGTVSIAAYVRGRSEDANIRRLFHDVSHLGRGSHLHIRATDETVTVDRRSMTPKPCLPAPNIMVEAWQSLVPLPEVRR